VTSEEPLIAIMPGARMANRMFQLMLAHEMRNRACVGQIAGCRLPHWGLVSPLPFCFHEESMLGEAQVRMLATCGISPTPSAVFASPE